MKKNVLLGEKTSVVTRFPGRLRIYVPELYRSSEEKNRIEASLSQQEGIHTVYANPLTGKVLILFHFSIPPDSTSESDVSRYRCASLRSISALRSLPRTNGMVS